MTEPSSRKPKRETTAIDGRLDPEIIAELAAELGEEVPALDQPGGEAPGSEDPARQDPDDAKGDSG